MNAPDSTPPTEPRALSERVRTLLSDAIAAVYRSESRVDRELRDALREAAAEARDRGLRPEELIISLKGLLDEIPGPVSRERLDMRDRIVSACIRAYFTS